MINLVVAEKCHIYKPLDIDHVKRLLGTLEGMDQQSSLILQTYWTPRMQRFVVIGNSFGAQTLIPRGGAMLVFHLQMCNVPGGPTWLIY